MENITDEIKNDILNRIGQKRFDHTIRVKDTAVELAAIFGVDTKKAEIAGFLHDCAKIRDTKELLKVAKDFDLEITEDMKKAPQIIHGYLGAKIAKELYKVDDKEILDAISSHTTGKENMSKLEKIIFLADYIEPVRNFPGVEEARKLSKENLDKAMIFSLNNTILFLMKKNQYIAINTVKARNYILEMENEKIF